jgi:hypothetical protein
MSTENNIQSFIKQNFIYKALLCGMTVASKTVNKENQTYSKQPVQPQAHSLHQQIKGHLCLTLTE